MEKHQQLAHQPDKEVLLELLKHKCDEQWTLISHYITAVTVYIAITGALLKFTLDKNATPALQSVLPIAGILVSGMGLFTIGLVEKIRLTISRDLTNLNARLGSPLASCDLKPIESMGMALVVFVTLIVLGWVFVMFTQ